jgi:SAM-dependent methyltransferase
MVTCCQCDGIENEFNTRLAERELRHFRKDGPRRSTRLLIDSLRWAVSPGATLLDVGGGIGAIHHVLLDKGAARATHIDASSAYIASARDEARRRGHADRVELIHGDFVALSPSLPDADVVTLDRVICCYPDMPALVGAAARKAGRAFGAVYPPDALWLRLGVRCINALMRLRRSEFRVFVHSPKAIEAVLREHGFERVTHRRTVAWEIATYRRTAEMPLRG